MDKKSLTERDICTKYITPAILNSGWDLHTQIREELYIVCASPWVRSLSAHLRAAMPQVFHTSKKNKKLD
jgi:type I site-specific restriction endonuclease